MEQMEDKEHANLAWTRGLAVASIARDVGSSSTNRSSDIMHFLPFCNGTEYFVDLSTPDLFQALTAVLCNSFRTV